MQLPSQDVSETARRLVELVHSLGQKFPGSYIIDVFKGSKSKQVLDASKCARTSLYMVVQISITSNAPRSLPYHLVSMLSSGFQARS